jgi:hypothetical protein
MCSTSGWASHLRSVTGISSGDYCPCRKFSQCFLASLLSPPAGWSADDKPDVSAACHAFEDGAEVTLTPSAQREVFVDQGGPLLATSVTEGRFRDPMSRQDRVDSFSYGVRGFTALHDCRKSKVLSMVSTGFPLQVGGVYPR